MLPQFLLEPPSFTSALLLQDGEEGFVSYRRKGGCVYSWIKHGPFEPFSGGGSSANPRTLQSNIILKTDHDSKLGFSECNATDS
jgi:hypothetical protein